MTVSGGPSQPSWLLADGANVNAGASSAHTLMVEGFTRALIEVYIDQTHDLHLRGSGVVDAAAYGWLWNDKAGTFNQTQHAGASVTGQGRAYQVDITGLRTLWVRVSNTSGAAATLTLRVTLTND